MRHLYTAECGQYAVATASLAPSNEYGPGVWYLHKIHVPRGFRGRGLGKALMELILNDADYEEIELRLEAAADPGGLSQNNLEAWYVRCGFTQDEHGYYVRAAQCQSIT